jgi:hypothetical protein
MADMEGDITALVAEVLNKTAGVKVADKDIKSMLASAEDKPEAA